MSFVLLLSGCFFDRLERSDENDISRVEQKQATLADQQDRAANLRRQEDQLTTELSERQLSLDELSRRVEEINAENGHALADNESAHRQYDYYLQQVHEANQQLAEIQRTTTPGAIEQRRERIASLKAQLKTELDALLR